MSVLTQAQVDNATNTKSTNESRASNIVQAERFVGQLIGNATTATRLQNNWRLRLTGDVDGYADVNASDADLAVKVKQADHATTADFVGSADYATKTALADLANLATFALESGESAHAGRATLADNATHANEATHADKATLADKAEELTWDMIQIVKEYPVVPMRRVLYIKVYSEFNDPRNWEIIGFKYMQDNGLVNETDLTLYRIRFTNRALTEDFLEHRRIWATPSPERTLSNIKGEIEEINVAENDNAVEQLKQREAKFFIQEDLL